MIDLITLVKPPLPEPDIEALVERNRLQINSKNGEVFYDNMSTKNLSRQKGVFIRVETSRKLKVECSLHKYWNEAQGGERNNANLFTMRQARKSVSRLLSDKGISPEGLRVYNYEIGLNLNVQHDCLCYLSRMKSIGATGNERQMYINPRYKDERVRTTVFHTHTRKYFKAYDKVYESVEKKRKAITEGNILRIETVNRRLDNCMAVDFFAPENLRRLAEAFFRDWRTLRFRQDIITPKGTGRARRQLCMEIIDKGTEAVLAEAKERHANGTLSEWEYRNTREFIAREWDGIRGQITFVPSDEEQEIRRLMHINRTLIMNDDFIK
jgi:hypothetical protein